MQGDYDINMDQDLTVKQPLFTNRKSSKNDSIGNNSGGIRSERDQDFDMMGDTYEKRLVNFIGHSQKKQLEQGQVIQIGPQNNTGFKKNSENEPQISLYDIQTNLSTKNISIFNFKKTLQTIIQCLNAFQLDQVTKFVRLIMDLPAFDQNFSEYYRKQNKIEIEPNDLNQVQSDISAKSNSPFTLPPSGIQTIFEIAAFLASLIDKCTNIENMHLITVIRHIINLESRFYVLPLKPQQFMEQNAQFVQNSNNDLRYQKIQEQIQNSFLSLFQFSDQVYSIKQIWYFYFVKRCINNFLNKNSENYNLSTKTKIHALRILNELNLASSELFAKFDFYKEEKHYIVKQKTEILRMQKQQLEDYSNALFDYCCKDSTKIRLHLSLVIEILINGENSIEKKSQALKMIEKLIINTRQCEQTIDQVEKILQQHSIISQLMRDQTHIQLLKKLPLIMKFLYDLGKIGTEKLKFLIKETVKGHEQFFRVVQFIVDNLKLKDLGSIFEFVKSLIVEQSQSLNPHVVGLIKSIVSNDNMAVKKKHKKKQSRKITNQSKSHVQIEMIVEDDLEKKIGIGNGEINQLAEEIFKYLLILIQNPKLQSLYIPILSKHVSFHISLLLPLLEQQFRTRLSKPKDYQTYFLSILEHCIKIDMDYVLRDPSQKQINPKQTHGNTPETKTNLNPKIIKQQQKQEQKEPRKYKFIANLVVNCNLYDSIFVMLCKFRFDKVITEKCLNVLSQVTKYYKVLEKNHIEMLWNILGLHYTNNFQKQQFFLFVKDILKNTIGVSQEAAKHIYFQILLKLNHEYFTSKIYDCLEIVFMRLNEDAGVLRYENQKNSLNYYSLNSVDLIGVDKFYYLLLWGEQKVSKKVMDFFFKLYCFKSSTELKQQFSFQIIQSIMKYLKINTESEAHLQLADSFDELNLHFSRAFQLFSNFNNQYQKLIDQKQQQKGIISVTINNVTRQALPPIKKTIEVDKNMQLKDFKQLIRKEINPQVRDIQLINKGKSLRGDGMSLRQLKIENKNTILVEDMNEPAAKKQIKDEQLRECRQTLEGIFGEQYSNKLLGYVAQKYLGEKLETICNWVMDEQKMKELEIQMKQKNRFKIEQKKNLSNGNQSHEEQVMSFGQILMSEIEQLLRVMAINRQQKQQRIQQQQHWALKSTIQLLLKYQIDKKLSQQILFHLKQNLINPSNLLIQQIYYQLPELIKRQELYELVLKYQEVFVKFYLSLFELDANELELDKNGLRKHQKTNFQNINYFIESYLGLKTFIDRLHTDKSHGYSSINKQVYWLYSLLISFCDIITRYENSHNTSVNPEIFQKDLFDSVNRLINTYFLLSNNQILGLLALINKLIDKVFTTARTTSRKLSNHHLFILLDLIDFLFQPFIYSLKTVPIITDNSIKQIFYSILLKLASSSNEILLKISGSIVKLGIQNRNRQHDNIDFKKNEFVGIQNLGCTCYINSLIQQLYHTRLPYKLIAQTNHEGLFELNHTFMLLYMTVKNAINIRSMIQQVKFYGQQIIPTIQQDVQEFLISLLDYVESCQGKPIIDSIFGGSYSEQLIFFSQKHTGKTFKKHKQEHFYNITLDIKGKKNLNQALVYFFRPQTLDDKIFCEEMGEKTCIVKRTFINHFPKILIFTLKRFEFDVENMVRKKLNDYLEFPQELDLTQFSWEKFAQEEKGKKEMQRQQQNEEVFIGQDKTQMRRAKVEIQKEDQRESHLYMLCGILIHSGSAEAGHYYSYIQRESKWYEFNDKIVTQINLPQIIKVECFGGESKSRNAYMLFYQRLENNFQENDLKRETCQKMQIEQPESYIQVQIDKTLPLEVQQRHHGTFLQLIPQNNYFKQLVVDENRHFIKERLFYDFFYRKFVSDIIALIRQPKANNPYHNECDKREEYLLSEKLVEIQKISNLINSQTQRPIIHFQSNQMMEIQKMKQVTYEEEERIQQERTRLSRENDIISGFLDESLKDNFI